MTIKGRQLFVGNLPFVVGWQDLKDLFRSAGNVQRANIMQGRDGRSKGHGIVLYATVADAKNAISTFDGYEWHGRKLEVREDRSAMDFPPPPPRTEGANTINQSELENEKISVSNSNGRSASVTSNEINGTTSSTQTSSSPVDYPNENITLNGITNNINNGTTYSDESTINNTTTGTNGLNNSNTNLQRQLFVGNLPFRVRWQDLKDLFRKAGTVLRADVAMGYDNRSKGHGTVLFGSLEDAKNAIAIFNHYNWQGRSLEVREDRGFVDSNNVNNQNNNNTPNPQQVSQETRRTVDPVPTHNHTQAPYLPNQIVCPTGIFFPTRGIPVPQPNLAGRLLFVGNLPFNCQWQDLKDLFRNAGNIIRADVSTNYDGRSRGFGTVLFATPEDARNAVGMYNGYEFQGRTLRVHFDKFSLPPMPPHHHHHNPHPHPVHLPPPVHQHHRPPPTLIPGIPHNYHLGPPPPIPHPHFIPPTHMGPFSPPLATPPLTSPPPFTATYNPLAHINSQPNTNSNNSAPFHPIPIHHSMGTTSQQTSSSQPQGMSQDQTTATATTASQFNGFGPIGKNNHSPQPTTSSSSISNLGALGFSGTSNTANGIVVTNGTDNNYGTGNDNVIHNITASFANLHLNPTPQQLFFHPPHHPHHRPPIPTSYHPPHPHQVVAHHHHQQHNHHPMNKNYETIMKFKQEVERNSNEGFEVFEYLQQVIRETPASPLKGK
ncbi:telomere maintenance protein [Gigaspora margarita]|uniref:Telomere maintenance protein n=1 Tax=Gigaspora margarita TaxID=4874 RepID=A0A8H3X2B9_GIGMA|nr:telomere maintenance protein [Gigaspora margarita]